MEKKAIAFELKDMDMTKREAVIAHAEYDTIDRVQDISRKGMFTKSWNENSSDINFYLNHNDEQAPGKVTKVWEDDKNAFTKAWLGTHTLGNDVLLMMDEGVIKKASYGYITHKSNIVNSNGKKARELKEVSHLETSVLTKIPAHPNAGVRSVTKSFFDLSEVKSLSQQEQDLLKNMISSDQSTLEELIMISSNLDPKSDLYTWVTYQISRRADSMGDLRSQLRYSLSEMKELNSHVRTMEKFCSNTKASDDCIKSIEIEIENAKQLISEYNTAGTQAAQALEPVASIEGKVFLDALTTFNKSLITN